MVEAVSFREVIEGDGSRDRDYVDYNVRRSRNSGPVGPTQGVDDAHPHPTDNEEDGW